MFPAQAVLFFAGLLLVGVLLKPLLRRLRIPISVVLVVLGFAGSELLTAYGFDTGIRWHNFQSIVFYRRLSSITGTPSSRWLTAWSCLPCSSRRSPWIRC